MANLDQLKQKYQPVLTAIQTEGGQVQSLNLEGEQLALNAKGPTENSKNRVWDAIKAVDPTFAGLKHNISVVGGKQVYIVQSGDNLSKISKHFFGNANRYMDSARANGLDEPDKIWSGQQLTFPE